MAERYLPEQGFFPTNVRDLEGFLPKEQLVKVEKLSTQLAEHLRYAANRLLKELDINFLNPLVIKPTELSAKLSFEFQKPPVPFVEIPEPLTPAKLTEKEPGEVREPVLLQKLQTQQVQWGRGRQNQVSSNLNKEQARADFSENDAIAEPLPATFVITQKEIAGQQMPFMELPPLATVYSGTTFVKESWLNRQTVAAIANKNDKVETVPAETVPVDAELIIPETQTLMPAELPSLAQTLNPQVDDYSPLPLATAEVTAATTALVLPTTELLPEVLAETFTAPQLEITPLANLVEASLTSATGNALAANTFAIASLAQGMHSYAQSGFATQTALANQGFSMPMGAMAMSSGELGGLAGAPLAV
jgi:hypothetical protein